MDVYFSHSYRDLRINAYFLEELEPQGFKLLADQKSTTWCVAKLERYLYELPGFLSIVTHRAGEPDALSYSPYIGHELSLARRARLPRLLFVDEGVLQRYPTQFPQDAVPFVPGSLASGRFRHRQAIENFKEKLAREERRYRVYKDRQATVVAAGRKAILQATEEIRDILAATYRVQVFKGKHLVTAFDDVSLFETLLESEVCVFLLDTHVTYVDVILGMAHAHSIPSIRIQYDPNATDSQPVLSGRIPWSKTPDLVAQFRRQLDSFRLGFVEAVQLARESGGAVEAMRTLATTRWDPTLDQAWDPNDGPGLLRHIHPEHPFVRDEVDRVRRLVGGSFAVKTGNADSLDICMHLYAELKRHHLAYELEPQTMSTGKQAIRTAQDILSSKAATCIDVACLFASLLKAAEQSAIVIVLQTDKFSHALAGFRAPNAASWDGTPELGDLRRDLSLQDIVLFEATGVLESEEPVALETREERRVGGKMLDFMTARTAAERLILSDVRLRNVVEVSAPVR